jgi:hypothetical protein
LEVKIDEIFTHSFAGLSNFEVVVNIFVDEDITFLFESYSGEVD